MCCSSQSSPSVKLAKKISLALGLVTSLISFAQVAMADPAGPASSATVPANPEGLSITIFWAGAALFACVAAVSEIILARKLHQQKALVAAGAVAAPAPQKRLFSVPSNGNGKGNGSKVFRFNNRPAKSGKQNNHANGDNGKRRRMFNYHKFYTEMVLQGPSPSSVADNAYNPYAGYYVEYEPPRNNNNNGNGHNGSHNSNGNGHHAPASNEAGANSDILATQKSLIQEQQRLIHEQARLIEEKSRLIAEKNQLLNRQSQMLDNNLL